MITLYYDRKNQYLVDESGNRLPSAYYPRFRYKDYLTVQVIVVDVVDNDLVPVDMSAIPSWQFSIAEDFDSDTDPLCRTLNDDIDASGSADGEIVGPIDANTTEFLTAVDGDDTKAGYMAVYGFDINGKQTENYQFQVVIGMSVDPGTGDPGAVPDDYYTKTEGDGRYMRNDLATAYSEETSPAATDKFPIQTSGGMKFVEAQNLPAGTVPDDSITAAKLAADAVETAKVKDENITTNKLATGERMTKANVEGVLTGAISSHTHAATAPASDSVDTAHIKDGAVTAEKLDVDLAESLVTKARIESVLTGAIATHTHNLSDLEIENGIDTPLVALDETDNGKQITAQVSTDTPPAGASLLLHLNGNATDYGAAGLAVTNTNVTFEASEGPQWGSQRAVFDGTAKLSVADSDGFAPGTNGAFLALARVSFATGTLAQTHAILSKESPASKGFRLEWNPTRGLVFSWADAAGAVFTGEMSVYWLPTVETCYTVGVAYSGTALTIFVTTGGTFTVAMATETRAVTLFNEANPLLIGESGETGEENNFTGTLDELLFFKGDPATFVVISGTGVTNSANYAPLDGDVLVTRKYDITDQTENQYVYYVDKTAGSDLNTGLTAATAIQNLTEAMARIGGRSGRFTIYLKYSTTHTLTNYISLGENSDSVNTAAASYRFESYGTPGSDPVIATGAYWFSLRGPVSVYFQRVVLTSSSGPIFSSAIGESNLTLISSWCYGEASTTPIFLVYQAAKMVVLAKSTIFTVLAGGTPATGQDLYEMTDESCGFEFRGDSNTYDGTPAYYLTPPNIAGKEGTDVDGVQLKDGGASLSGQSGVLVTLASDQAVADVSIDLAALATEIYDVLGEFNNTASEVGGVAAYAFKPKTAGTYLICCMGTTENISDTKRGWVYVRKNGGNLVRASAHAAVAGAVSPNLAVTVKLTTDDYIQLFFYHVHGASRNYIAGIYSTYLSINKIA